MNLENYKKLMDFLDKNIKSIHSGTLYRLLKKDKRVRKFLGIKKLKVWRLLTHTLTLSHYEYLQGFTSMNLKVTLKSPRRHSLGSVKIDDYEHPYPLCIFYHFIDFSLFNFKKSSRSDCIL